MAQKQKHLIISAHIKSVCQTTVIVLMTAFLVLNVTFVAQGATEDTADDIFDDISTDISSKKQKIQELNQQSEVYKQNISEKQREAASLRNETYLLNNQVSLTNNEIETKQTEIEKIKLEIKKIESNIGEKKDIIETEKEQISELIRVIYKKDEKSYLEVALLNKSLSDFYNEVKSLNDIEASIKKELDKYLVIKKDLQIQHEDLEGKRLELDDTKASLSARKSDLTEQLDYQSLILDQTENTEEEYQDLLAELTAEAKGVQAEISSLERRMRAKLAEERGEEYFGEFSGEFVWPVNSKVITCGWFCEGYPYEKWLGPHRAIDIAISQGSPVYAAADGYVAIARKLDWKVDYLGRKRPAYNYISIIHNEELSTVYGHLSQVSVTEGDFVTQGQVIGSSGGLPGTAGAGAFSTGAHIHFEVRKVNENGIPVPVDPMNYL